MKLAREQKLKNFIYTNLNNYDVNKNSKQSHSKVGLVNNNLKRSKVKGNKININQIIKRNLSKHNSDLDKYFIKMTNDIIYDEKKHIVCLFKDYLLWDEISDFLKRFYYNFESITRIPKISGYYEKYSLMSPIYFKLTCYKIMAKNVKKKKKVLEIMEENEDRLEEQKAGMRVEEDKEKEDYSRLLKTSLIEEPTIINNIPLTTPVKKNEDELRNTNFNHNHNLNNFKKQLNFETVNSGVCSGGVYVNLSFISNNNDGDNKKILPYYDNNDILNEDFSHIKCINVSNNFSIFSQFNNFILDEKNEKMNNNPNNQKNQINNNRTKNLIEPLDKKEFMKIDKLITEVENNPPPYNNQTRKQNGKEKVTLLVPLNTSPELSKIKSNINDSGKVVFKKIEFNKLDLKNLNSINTPNSPNSISNSNKISVHNTNSKKLPNTTRSNNRFIEGTLCSNSHSKTQSKNKNEKVVPDTVISFNAKKTSNTNDIKNKLSIAKNMVSNIKTDPNSNTNAVQADKIIPIKNSNPNNFQTNNYLKTTHDKNNVLKVKLSNPNIKTTPLKKNINEKENLKNDNLQNKNLPNTLRSLNPNSNNSKNNSSDKLIKTNSLKKSTNNNNYPSSSSSIYNINLNLNLNLNLNMLNKNNTAEKIVSGPLTERPSILHINSSKIDKILDKTERVMIANIKANEKYKKLSRNMNVKNFILNYGSSGGVLNNENKNFNANLKSKKPKNIVIANSNNCGPYLKKSLSKENSNSKEPLLTTNSVKNNFNVYYKRFLTDNLNTNSSNADNSISMSKTQKRINIGNSKNPIENLKYNLLGGAIVSSNAYSNSSSTFNQRNFYKNNIKRADSNCKPMSINMKKNQFENSKELAKYPLTSRNEKDSIKIFGNL
jgi:hypothetical protein